MVGRHASQYMPTKLCPCCWGFSILFWVYPQFCSCWLSELLSHKSSLTPSDLTLVYSDILTALRWLRSGCVEEYKYCRFSLNHVFFHSASHLPFLQPTASLTIIWTSIHFTRVISNLISHSQHLSLCLILSSTSTSTRRKIFRSLMERSSSSPEVCHWSVPSSSIRRLSKTGTSGLGKASVIALAKHSPAHIYFTGRNNKAAQELIDEIQMEKPSVKLTFVKMDMNSLASVKEACKEFVHDRLDVLMSVHQIISFILQLTAADCNLGATQVSCSYLQVSATTASSFTLPSIISLMPWSFRNWCQSWRRLLVIQSRMYAFCVWRRQLGKVTPAMVLPSRQSEPHRKDSWDHLSDMRTCTPPDLTLECPLTKIHL